jgi:hypothetical protein
MRLPAYGDLVRTGTYSMNRCQPQTLASVTVTARMQQYRMLTGNEATAKAHLLLQPSHSRCRLPGQLQVVIEVMHLLLQASS